LTRLQKWRAILSRAFKAFLKGPAAASRAKLTQPERAKSQNAATSSRPTAAFRLKSEVTTEPRLLTQINARAL
jgi:hypothetical protein